MILFSSDRPYDAQNALTNLEYYRKREKILEQWDKDKNFIADKYVPDENESQETSNKKSEEYGKEIKKIGDRYRALLLDLESRPRKPDESCKCW